MPSTALMRVRWNSQPGLVVAVASLLLIGGCSSATGEGESANGVGLDRFMEQEIGFGACDPSIVNAQPQIPEVLELPEEGTRCTL